MSDLDDARQKICDIDEQMLKLFIKRMEVVQEVAEYKRANNMAVTDLKREEELLANNMAKLTVDHLKPYYKTFFNGVLTASKDYQKNLLKKHYALLGKDVSHSYSALIHNYVFGKMGVNAQYQLISCEECELKDYIFKLRQGEFAGFNITIPYKKTIMHYLDDLDFKAKAIGSVNTVYLQDGKVIGTNTDYDGFLALIKANKIEVLAKDCYVLGTGGAACSVAAVLKDLGGNVFYVSREPKAEQISYSKLSGRKIDILVNTTPVGMYPDVDKCPIDINIIKNCSVVIDIIFNPPLTKLLKLANSTYNGMTMLIAQALKADEVWLGCEIPLLTEEVYQNLKVLE